MTFAYWSSSSPSLLSPRAADNYVAQRETAPTTSASEEQLKGNSSEPISTGTLSPVSKQKELPIAGRILQKGVDVLVEQEGVSIHALQTFVSISGKQHYFFLSAWDLWRPWGEARSVRDVQVALHVISSSRQLMVHLCYLQLSFLCLTLNTRRDSTELIKTILVHSCLTH